MGHPRFVEVPAKLGSQRVAPSRSNGGAMAGIQRLWSDKQGQIMAEYALILALILVLVVGTLRFLGSSILR
jgi:Flp pilus assembly pilin Flp